MTKTKLKHSVIADIGKRFYIFQSTFPNHAALAKSKVGN